MKNWWQYGIATIAGQGGNFGVATPLGLLSRRKVTKPAFDYNPAFIVAAEEEVKKRNLNLK